LLVQAVTNVPLSTVAPHCSTRDPGGGVGSRSEGWSWVGLGVCKVGGVGSGFHVLQWGPSPWAKRLNWNRSRGIVEGLLNAYLLLFWCVCNLAILKAASYQTTTNTEHAQTVYFLVLHLQN